MNTVKTKTKSVGVVLSVFICVHLWLIPHSAAQEKKEPVVKVAMPLGVAAGKSTKVLLRGLRFDGATEVRAGGAFAAILGPPKKVTVKKEHADLLGDTTLEVEVAVPVDAPEELELVVVTPGGTSPLHRLKVDRSLPTKEREPNNGFREAQSLMLPATVAGTIQAELDVDVYRFDAKAGQTLVAEVLAARLGSPLDGILTLYDATFHTVATADDSAGQRDPRLSVKLPRDGAYYLAVTDAHDLGGPSHVYRLLVRAGP